MLTGLVIVCCTGFTTMDPWFWLRCQEVSHFYQNWANTKYFFFLYPVFEQMPIYAVNCLEVCLYQPNNKKQVLPGHLTAVCLVRSWDKTSFLPDALKTPAFSYQCHKTCRNAIYFRLADLLWNLSASGWWTHNL